MVEVLMGDPITVILNNTLFLFWMAGTVCMAVVGLVHWLRAKRKPQSQPYKHTYTHCVVCSSAKPCSTEPKCVPCTDNYNKWREEAFAFLSKTDVFEGHTDQAVAVFDKGVFQYVAYPEYLPCIITAGPEAFTITQQEVEQWKLTTQNS